jgi:WD40 repeat protein
MGHTDAVACVAFVDDVTIMSGSNDTTIKVWDAVSASLVRTYTGHVCGVSSITPASNGTFISAGADQTIKLWIFTSLVPPSRNSEEETLQDVLGIEGNTCNACSVGIEGREVNVWNGQVA